MNQVFADTSYYVALTSEHDQHHADAVAHAQTFHGGIVTTDFVLVEVGNLMSRTVDRHAFLRLLEMLRTDLQTTVVAATRRLFDAGLSLFARRMDKDWSFTDCISFWVMRHQRLTDVLTADHHFEQAGFRILLR